MRWILIMNYTKFFYVVATTGNVTAAAKELHISQPAVSKHIRNLECSLGGPLFIRSNQGMILTETDVPFINQLKMVSMLLVMLI